MFPSNHHYKYNSRHFYGIVQSSYICILDCNFDRSTCEYKSFVKYKLRMTHVDFDCKTLTLLDMERCMQCLSNLEHIDTGQFCDDIRHHFRTCTSTNILVHMFHLRMDVHISNQCNPVHKHILRLCDHRSYYHKQRLDIFLYSLCEWSRNKSNYSILILFREITIVSYPVHNSLFRMVLSNHLRAILCYKCICPFEHRMLNYYSNGIHIGNRHHKDLADILCHM